MSQEVKGSGVGWGEGVALLSMCIYNALFTANHTPLLFSQCVHTLKESGIYEVKTQPNESIQHFIDQHCHRAHTFTIVWATIMHVSNEGNRFPIIRIKTGFIYIR